MARRLVRHQASLIALTLVTLAACSKRGCACAAGYAPEIGVEDLDPLSFEVWLPSGQDLGSLYFKLGAPDAKDMCPRLPEGTSATLNGVKTDVRSLGGATGTKLADTNCKRAEFFWRSSPTDGQPTTNIVVDDGHAKVACTLGVGLPLRLTSPSVKAIGDSVTLLVEIGAPGSTLSIKQAQVGVEGETTLMHLMAESVRHEGSRASISIPTEWLAKAEKYQLVVDAMIAPDVTCSPKRKHSATALVQTRAILAFTVAR